ncbi:protein kinase [Azoarcus sp. TTM-91]|uniref:protein kinase domain-containing protein n=1 Tax=Azoarcus sp. TTM-91 TaxID=2691581 RepID=UPI00145DE4A1|nr:protein kinase [Azoarcus sp. TTM-91]
MSANDDDDKTVVLGGAAAAARPPAAAENPHNALPIGFRLGEFEIIDLVGEGGFGIVYLAQDHSLERKVALKEYMPASLASRSGNTTVSVRSERHRDTFEIGRRSFVNEARLLAQFDHPALVKVYRFWEDNGTAYMAMPYYDGKTLREVLKQRASAPDESWIRKVLAPVVDALELIHRESCFHRDVAPDNIMLLRDDRPVLLDFGAARRVIGDMTQALTVILKPGYAPIEQYAEMPGMQQGPWTDVYALAAVIYFMIVGKTPPPSVGRMMQDSYQPLAELAAGRYGDRFLRGVDHCLRVRAEERPQSMAEMRELLGWGLDSPLFAASTPAEPARGRPRESERIAVSPAASNGSKGLIAGGVVALVAALAAGGYWWTRPAAEPAPPTAEAGAPAAAPVVQTPPPAVPPKALPRPAQPTLAEALATTLGHADPGLLPGLQAPASVVIGQDTLKLALASLGAGHLYLFLWDSADDRVYRLFPNALDADNAIGPGDAFHVPRPLMDKPWAYAAKAPVGEWRLLAVVSEQARDFPQGVFTREGEFFVAHRTALESAFAAGADIGALIGTPRCVTATPCSGRYGAQVASIQEALPPPRVESPVQAPRAPAPRPEAAMAAPSQPAVPPAAEKPPARKPARGEDSLKAEREYMQQLNKDLDKLLQPER